MAKISFINKNSAVSSGATGITLTKPTDTAENDVIIAIIGVEDNSDRINSQPDGWTQYVNATVGSRAIHIYAYFKKAGSGEPADYSWGIDATDEIFGIIATYRGVKISPAVGIGNNSVSTSTSAEEPTAPAITVQGVDNAVLFFCINAYGTTYLAPSGFTERDDVRTGTGSGNISGCLADDLTTAAGSTGTVAADATNTDYHVSCLLELLALKVESAGGIATAETFGTAKLVGHVLAAGAIATALAFGSPSVVTPTEAISTSGYSISSGQAFGTPSLEGKILSVGNISSAGAIGTPALVGTIHAAGNIATGEAIGTVVPIGILSASGIATGSAIGSDALVGTIVASAIASAEVVGSQKVLNYPPRLCGDIDSGEAFGSPSLGGTIVASGIVSGEVIGDAELPAAASSPISVSGYSIASGEAFGDATVGYRIQAFTPIASAEAHGSQNVVGIIKPSSIASSEAIGTLDIHARKLCGGIVSAETFGTPQLNDLSSTAILSAGGITSGEAFGTAVVRQFVISGVSGIASSEVFGDTIVRDRKKCGGIASQETFGEPAVVTGAPGIHLTGYSIPSAESFGSHYVQGPIQASSIASAEAFGYTWVYEINFCGNIASAEAFGTPAIVGSEASAIKDISGIASTGAVGTPRVVGEISTNVIATGYASGTAVIVGIIKPTGIVSEEAVGTPGSAKQRIAVTAIDPPENGGFGDSTIGYCPTLVAVIANKITGAGRIFPSSALGSPALVGTIVPSAIDSGEAFGDALVHVAPLQPSSISSDEVFGTPRLKAKILASGIASAGVATYTALVWNKIWLDEMTLELTSGITTEIELFSRIDNEIEIFSKFGGR